MKLPDPATRMFDWCPAWRGVVGEAGLGIALFVAGLALGVPVDWLWNASPWSMVAAILILIVASLLMLAGLGFLLITMMLIVCHVFGGFVMVLVHPNSVWVYESPREDLFQKTVVVPFEAIVWVNRERTKRNRECLRVVHGPDLKTETISEIRPSDVDALFAILAERCPRAVTPDPPAGWQPPRN